MLSFLSPCVLPLVPAYLSMVSGLSAAELGALDRPARTDGAPTPAVPVVVADPHRHPPKESDAHRPGGPVTTADRRPGRTPAGTDDLRRSAAAPPGILAFIAGSP